MASWDADRKEVHLRLARARAVLRRADAVFSTWKEHSPINQLRSGEITVAEAPPEVAAVLEGVRRRVTVRGWFDPWAMPGGVDPTGYVKGWAAQRALATLAMPGVTGGDRQRRGRHSCLRPPGTGTALQGRHVDPSDRRRFACVVESPAGSQHRGHPSAAQHLIDPRTGQSAPRAASASVTGPDLGLADALATALAVAGPAGLAFIEPIEGYEGFIIGYDGRGNRRPVSRSTPTGPVPRLRANTEPYRGIKQPVVTKRLDPLHLPIGQRRG